MAKYSTHNRLIWLLSLSFMVVLTPSVSEAQNGGLAAVPPTKTKSAEQKTAEKTLNQEREMLKFEQNVGQIKPEAVLFSTTDAQASYYFLKNEIRSVVTSRKDSAQTAYALQFVGANEGVQVEGLGKSRDAHGARNYITTEGSFADVPKFNRIHYKALWAGVNAMFYESQEGKGTMKYDFLVQPNADPSVVRLKMDGVKDLKINAKGELEFTTPFGTLQKGKPYTYQIINGKKVEVASEYTLNVAGEIGFKLSKYDPSVTLVIDPIALKWSTYLMADARWFDDFFVHPTTGRIYLVGYTYKPSFPTTTGVPFKGSADVFITCMEKDGTAVVWSTLIGGSSFDRGYTIHVDAAGDVYVIGTTSSSDMPFGTVAPYDAIGGVLGFTDMFVARLNSTGTTLKYNTYLGGSGEDGYYRFRKMVVENGIVYFGSSIRVGDYPTTPDAYQPTTTGEFVKAVFTVLNTNVGGKAGLVYSTYFNGPAGTASNLSTEITETEQDKDGNIWLTGKTNYDPSFPISANAVQKYGDIGITGRANFIAKFSKSGQYLYSSYVCPFWSPTFTAIEAPSIDVDAQGNLYVASATAVLSATIQKAPNILAYHELSPLSSLQDGSQLDFGYVAKIPYNLSPQFDFVSIFPSNADDDDAEPEVAVDKKGNIHLFTHGGSYGGNAYHPITAGAANSYISSIYTTPSVYYVLPPSGSSVLYGSVLCSYWGLANYGLVVNDKCEAYILGETYGSDNNYPITPSYRDFESNSQKSVYNSTTDHGFALTVFHEPTPNNNTITNFAPGNNTFCVGGAIWQNPNDGPIAGTTPSFLSGDGSSPTHNLPNIRYNLSPVTAHPTPASPALKYQWQKRVNGGAWINVGNGTFDLYKPQSEPAAGTVDYRRLVIGYCGDTLSPSNTATATISGTFNMQINTPTKPVYYCPGTVTDLGVTITGATGNISWQWYDGFAPLSNSTISPASGSGVAQGSFTASIAAGVTGSGFYRLVVEDAGGCRKEAFVSIAPKTASAGRTASVALCPGATTSATLGPDAVNPDFQYSWTGPSGFTSTLPNPSVTVAGTYNLQVKLAADASFCSPGTSVTVTTATAHAAALTAISDKGFCQSDDPAGIGLSGAQPTGYAFQWVPGTNLDNALAYSPKFDPGNVAGGFPIGSITYTFSALRLSDGCIFEDQVVVTDTARALAQAGIDKPACGTDPSQNFGAPETTGNYFQWRAVGTTYPGGVAALTSHSKFKMDGVATNLGTNKFLVAHFPDHTACYTIDYEIIGSYVPFANGCYTRDTARLFYCPTCGGGNWCSDLTSNAGGTNGACGGSTNWIGGESLAGLTYTWETHSVNGVVQAGSNREPRGLYYLNTNGTKGAQLPISGAHPSKAIADFDNAVWGWSGANVVIYRLRANGNFGEGTIDCHRDIQVFSADDAVPAIGVIDQSLCVVPAPGVRLGTAGQSTPYTLDGSDYTQAPNSAFNWAWTSVNGQPSGTITAGATTRFPTFNPTSTTSYLVTASDPVTGCYAKDTLTIYVKSVTANAGSNLNNVCPGSLVQLGTSPTLGHTYAWSPSAGLNFPIGTPNSTTAQPYLTVPNTPTPPAAITYTVTVTDTETGCQATDDIVINTSSAAPTITIPGTTTFEACPNVSFEFGPYVFLPGVSYQWSVVSGSANLSWLSSTTISRPIVTLPSNFTGPAVFRITVTKGDCGSVTQDYTINSATNPAISLGGPFTADCANPSTTQIGETALAGYTYRWSPSAGLFTNNTLTTPYAGSNLARPFARPLATTTYTVTRTTTTGCSQTATVTVNPPTGVAVNAGADKAYCGTSITIGSTGSGTLSWSAIGYDANPNAITAPTAIAAPMSSATMLGYIGGSANSATRSFATGTPSVGKYVYRVTSTDGGCSISDDVVVVVPNMPTGLVGGSQNVCPGSTVRIGSGTAPSTGSFQWADISPSTGNSFINTPTDARPYVTPSVTTTYQLVYTDVATGCTTDEQVTVVVNARPNIADVSAPIACAPLAAQNLTSLVSGYGSLVSPAWYRDVFPGGSTVATPTSVTPSVTTDYYLVATNSFGCKDTAKMTINVANPQTPNIQPTLNVNCSTTSIDLAAYQGNPSQAGYTLEWHNANNTNAGSLLSSTVISTSGTYYLFEKAPSPSNCYSASDNIVVLFVTPNTPSVTSPQMNNCPTTTVNLNTVSASLTPSVSGGVFEWRTTNSSTSPLVSTPTAVGAGTYYLFEKGPDGCYSAAYAVQVQIQACCPAPTCIPVTIVRSN
jgi:hypothetical protein